MASHTQDSTQPARRKSRCFGGRRRTPSGFPPPPTRVPPRAYASQGKGSTELPSPLTSSAEFLSPYMRLADHVLIGARSNPCVIRCNAATHSGPFLRLGVCLEPPLQVVAYTRLVLWRR